MELAPIFSESLSAKLCGIAALVAPTEHIQSRLLQSFLDVVAHRGPDDEGYAALRQGSEPTCWGGPATPLDAYSYPFPSPLQSAPPGGSFQIGLGSRRLAITDVSVAGHQPYSSRDANLWMVFNGQIYNHCDLRPQLEALGHRFSTECDTETLLAAYAAWGTACLDKLVGQFAFVILDRRKRTFFAARDRFAIKPLYFSVWGGTLCFASEIKQFSRLPGWRAELNHQKAFEFLRWGVSDQNHETLFANVQQVRGGHFLTGSWQEPCSRLTQQRWYEIRSQTVPRDFQEATEVFRQYLTRAVNCRAATALPLGQSLSGGIDSVSIASIMLGSGHPVHSYTALSEDPKMNERQWVENLLRANDKIKPTFCTPRLDDFLQELPQLIWHQDEPFSDATLFAEWSVFRSQKAAGVRVSLEGHGSDEYLLGYSTFLGPYFSQSWRQGGLGAALKNLLQLCRTGFVGPASLAVLLGRQFISQRTLDFYRKLRGYPAGVRPAWLSERLQADAGQASRLGNRHFDVPSYQLDCLLGGGLAHQLHWSDRSSMAHSIESRVPFLDHRLVEFSLSLPAEFLFRDGRTKAILRAACRPYAPARSLNRGSKVGYGTAEQSWAQRQNPDAMLRLCRQAVQASQGIFHEATMNKCTRMIKGEIAYHPWLWRMLSFGLWMERFQVHTTEGPPAEAGQPLLTTSTSPE